MTKIYYPKNIAKILTKRWNQYIGGDYTPPILPPPKILEIILDYAFYASLETEEDRPVRFNLCINSSSYELKRQYSKSNDLEIWKFTEPRTFTIQEIRRLSVATNFQTSAIWVRYSKDKTNKLFITGIINLGESWEKARNAVSYNYENLPDALLVKVESPGKILIYQGNNCVETFIKGQIRKRESVPELMDLYGAYKLFNETQKLLRPRIKRPKHEYIKKWHEFEWLSIFNTVLAIVNTIQNNGHGGTLIYTNKSKDLLKSGFIKCKYTFPINNNILASRYINFINIRHQLGDLWYLKEYENKTVSEKNIQILDAKFTSALDKLTETCSFIGNLSGSDGAIIINTDFSIIGFGSEISLEKLSNFIVYKVNDPIKKSRIKLDSEQFGMRHRSALRLVSSTIDTVAFVISHDGGVSFIWKEEGKVYFKENVKTTNQNIILA